MPRHHQLSHVLTLAMLLSLGQRAARAEPTVIGSLSIDTHAVWSKEGSPYIVTGKVVVSKGHNASLTIRPGTLVKFASVGEIVGEEAACG